MLLSQKKGMRWGTWVAQSVKRPILDLAVHEIEPHFGLRADIVGPAWDSLSLSLSLYTFPAPLSLSK